MKPKHLDCPLVAGCSTDHKVCVSVRFSEKFGFKQLFNVIKQGFHTMLPTGVLAFNGAARNCSDGCLDDPYCVDSGSGTIAQNPGYFGFTNA